MTFDGKFMYTMIQICQRLNFMYQTLKHDENNIHIYDELDINQNNLKKVLIILTGNTTSMMRYGIENTTILTSSSKQNKRMV